MLKKQLFSHLIYFSFNLFRSDRNKKLGQFVLNRNFFFEINLREHTYVHIQSLPLTNLMCASRKFYI